MIEQILPAGVAMAEVLNDDARGPGPLADGLFAVEAHQIRRASPARRQEFVTARQCARDALSRMGFGPVPIPRGPRGEPLWPDAVVGSITHCRGYRAAAVASRERFSGVGIDAEPHAALPDGVLAAISVPDERDRLAALARQRPATAWDRLLFCIKESIFKAWYPLTGHELDFGDAEVVLDPAEQAFAATLTVDGSGRPPTSATLTGRYLVRDDLLLAACVTPV